MCGNAFLPFYPVVLFCLILMAQFGRLSHTFSCIQSSTAKMVVRQEPDTPQSAACRF